MFLSLGLKTVLHLLVVQECVHTNHVHGYTTSVAIALFQLFHVLLELTPKTVFYELN